MAGALDRGGWQQLSGLLDEGLDLDEAARGPWLEAWRQRDAVLAQRLERMLASALAAQAQEPAPDGPFAGRLAAALAAGEPAGLAAARLGAWQLIEKIGEGGMGEVWLAQRCDGLFEARAAIKLLRADMAGPGLAARFARERALLGRLAHPGIARLLDAGVEGERAYLVLEHVAGLALSEHVRQQQLGLEARVRLLLAVARAVEHAHGQLIVHRDLKPGNVMVTPDGSPKLLDFGIAGLLDEQGDASDTELTRQAGRRLTPAYAAPEQIAGGAIGIAADVYSLGVMLYELASGVLPFGANAGSRTALEHAVLHTEPARLSRTTVPEERPGARPGPGRPADFARARGDLEAVAAKAMRKKPAERYVSVRALIDDLQAWLEHRPVSVRQDDWRHRSRLWLRRHAGLALGATLVTLSLSAGLSAALWQWQRASAAARSAEAVSRYLGELLASANPDQHGGQPPTVLQLLEKSRQELDQKFADDPETRLRLTEVLVTTYRDLNRYDHAIPLAQSQIEQATARYGADDVRTLEARQDLARIYVSQGSPAQVIALAEPLHAALVRAYGEVSGPHANLLYLLAVAYARVGRLDDSEAVLARARPIVDRLYRPEEFEHLFFENYVHSLRVAQGRLGEAEALLRATEPRWAAAPARYARFVLVLRRNLLAVQLRQSRYAGFESAARGLLVEMDALLGPGNDMAAGMRAELARYYSETGDADRAAAEQTQALAQLKAAAVAHPAQRLPRQAAALLAQTLAGAANRTATTTTTATAGAASALLAELQATPAVSGPARVEAAMALLRVGLLQQDLALAEQAQRLAGAEAVLQTSRMLAARLQQLQGQVLRARGDAVAALPLIERQLQYLDQLPEPQPYLRWSAQLDWALGLCRAGDTRLAEALQRADALRPPTLPAGSQGLDGLRRQLGQGRCASSAGWDGFF